VRAGFFVMAGGGLPEILRDSQDPDLVRFRERAFEAKLFTDGEDLARQARPYTDPIDPLTWADRIAPEQVLLISARFDQVIARAHPRRSGGRSAGRAGSRCRPATTSSCRTSGGPSGAAPTTSTGCSRRPAGRTREGAEPSRTHGLPCACERCRPSGRCSRSRILGTNSPRSASMRACSLRCCSSVLLLGPASSYADRQALPAWRNLVAEEADRLRFGITAHWSRERLGSHFGLGVGWSRRSAGTTPTGSS
jgi:hypothetical protein